MRWPAAVAACALVLSPAVARADIPGALGDASAAAAAGDWPRAQQLLAPLRPLALTLADRAEVERLSGLAAYFAGADAAAEAHYLAFLRVDPDGSLDPALYPPEALAFFEGVKTRHRAEITAQRPAAHRYFILNFVPVIAQRQNGEPTKGWIIGGTLGALLVAQGTTFWILHAWCSETSNDGQSSATCDDHANHAHAATELRTANLVLGIGAIATYAYGVYDGVTRYRERSHALTLQPFASTSEHASVVGIAGEF